MAPQHLLCWKPLALLDFPMLFIHCASIGVIGVPSIIAIENNFWTLGVA